MEIKEEVINGNTLTTLTKGHFIWDLCLNIFRNEQQTKKNSAMN